MSEATKAVREEIKALEAKLDRVRAEAVVVETSIQIHKDFLGRLNGAAPKVAQRAAPQKPKRGKAKRKVSMRATPAKPEEMWTRRAIVWHLLGHGPGEGLAPGVVHRDLVALIPDGQRLPTRAATHQMIYSTPLFVGNGRYGQNARVTRASAGTFKDELGRLDAARPQARWAGPRDFSNCISELQKHAPSGIKV